jgi:hypothetical protein
MDISAISKSLLQLVINNNLPHKISREKMDQMDVNLLPMPSRLQLQYRIVDGLSTISAPISRLSKSYVARTRSTPIVYEEPFVWYYMYGLRYRQNLRPS